MAIGGTVRHDLRGLEARLRLHPQELLAADVRTKNRTVSATRREAIRDLAVALPGLKRASIRNQLKMKLATRAVPRAVLEFSAKRFRLFGNFGARQTRSGVRSRVPWRLETLEGQVVPAQVLAHAFIQRSTKSGVANVWIRLGGQRYPITAILASSLSSAFKHRGLGARLIAFGRVRQRVVFAQELKFRVSQRLTRSL